RGQVEGDREPGLALGQVGAVQLVGGLGGGVARVGPHHPRTVRLALVGHAPFSAAGPTAVTPDARSDLTGRQNRRVTAATPTGRLLAGRWTGVVRRRVVAPP